MKKMMKAAICGAALVASLGLGMIAEAGSIPTGKVPLHTYAVRKVTCYTSPGGAAKGWIDPGDYVIVTQIRNDGWAYGSYPVKNGRTSRWFKANDLVYNINFANQDRYSPKNNTYVYKDANRSSNIGSVWGNEAITVVSDYGQNRQLIYKISGGYKMGWMPYWDCWTYEQAFGKPVPVPPPPVTSWDSKVGKVVANLSNTSCYSSPTNCHGRFKKSYKESKWPYKYHASNCTWYAWGRMKEVKGIELSFSGSANGGNWGNSVSKNNCYVDSNLTSQCVAERNGHVAFVEYVNGNNVYYTEANVNSNTDFKVIKTTVSAFKNKGFYRFIHKR